MNNRENEEQALRIKELTSRIELLEKQVQTLGPAKKKLLIVLSSGTMDKAMVAFMVANWAVAMKYEVNIFCTLWALALLRKKNKMEGNTFLEKAAKIMMKKGPDNAVLSQMHMMGMGTSFMKQLLKQHNFSSLKESMASAQELGVQIYTCEKMMNVMGVKNEEIAEGVQTMSWVEFIEKMSEASVTLTF